MNEHSGAIIIQARMGSTRMPGKVLSPFHDGRCILDVIVDSLKASRYQLPICIATSDHATDDVIAAFSSKRGVRCYRGDEQDVLVRFIRAAEEQRVEWVVRVCADNPFLDTDLMDVLIASFLETQPDYCSFLAAAGVPSIRSHWGIFTEVVSVSALKKVADLTQEKLYREHVTNYIYAHEEIFDCKWIEAPKEVFEVKGIRFTIDTPADFALMQRIWTVLAERDITPNFRHALDILTELPEFKSIMQEQIVINSK